MHWKPVGLKTRHHEMIRLAFLGQTNKEIASAIGVSPQTVCCVLASPLAKAEIARLKAEADESITNVPARVKLQKEMEDAAIAAIHLRSKWMNDDNVNIRTREVISRHFADRVIFEKETDDSKELSYRALLRGMREAVAAMRPTVQQNNTIIIPERSVSDASNIVELELGEHVSSAA